MSEQFLLAHDVNSAPQIFAAPKASKRPNDSHENTNMPHTQ